MGRIQMDLGVPEVEQASSSAQPFILSGSPIQKLRPKPAIIQLVLSLGKYKIEMLPSTKYSPSLLAQVILYNEKKGNVMLSFAEHEFTCDSGLCVPMVKRCDLKLDCDDMSDESDCRLVHVNPKQYQKVTDSVQETRN